MANEELFVTLVPAVIAAVVSLIVGVASALVTVWLQRDRLRTELKLEFATETAIRELLSDKRFPERKRTFRAIGRRLNGLREDDLRRALIRAGAVSFKRRKDDEELWGLRELNRDLWSDDTEDDDARG